MLIAMLSLTLLAPNHLPTARTDVASNPAVTVTVDSARREVKLVAGPFTLAAMPAGMAYADPDAHHTAGMGTPFLAFQWPVTGWIRGFQLAITDAAGRPLSRQLVHHVALVNPSRRALVYDAVERSLAAGRETEDVTLPGSIGLPMDIGATLGLAAAWANETGTDIEGAYLAVTISWTPATRSIRPVDILPLYLDVNYQGAGHQNSYDLPAGPSSRDHEFTMPVDGRLLAAGGHLHTHATELVLEDLTTGRAVVRLRTKVDGDGELVGVERKLFGVRGDGVRLHAGRRYRLTARYNNPTGEVIVNGAMGMMIGLLAPSDLAQWPAVDLASPAMRADLASLRSTTSYGTGGTGR